jgi:glycine oxidase
MMVENSGMRKRVRRRNPRCRTRFERIRPIFFPIPPHREEGGLKLSSHKPSDHTVDDVIVVGGGVAGLSVAWRLARQGIPTTVLEKGPAEGVAGAASRAAGGMLAPSAEVKFEEMGLYRFAAESLRRWPSFASDLEAASGVTVGYRDEGTLVVAVDRDDAEALRRLFRFQREQGLNVEWVTTADALAMEAFLSPRIAGAIHAPDDHQVDNRAVMDALLAALARDAHAEVRTGAEVVAVEPDDQLPAVRLADGSRLAARVVVLAAGAWVRRIEGLPEPLPVRPVKGQMLSFAMERPFELSRVIRTPRAYLVPKLDGRLVLGATAEEMGFDNRITGGGLYRLLEAAVEAVPGVEELPVTETWSGLRPASRDHLPLLGFGAAPGIAAAAGFFRHGILLAPIAAEELALEIASRLAGGTETSPWIAPFSPARLTGTAS